MDSANAGKPGERAGWRETIEGQLREGVESSALAHALAAQEVLLWAGFTLDGGLSWTAYRQDGDELGVIAVNASRGQRGDRDRIAAC